MKKEFSTVLDMSRWLAAFVVTLSHIRHIVLADYSDIVNKNLFIKAFYVVTGFGHEAVMVFFVLSGFLVGGTTLKKWKTVSLPDFFVHRFSRIYTVFIPALLLGYALDYIGSSYFNGSGFYTPADQLAAGLPTSVFNSHVFHPLGFRALLDKLLMKDGHLGTNVPLWSLVYEWWYYCIFAACFGLCLRKNLYIRLACVLGLAALTAYCTLSLWVWMIIWWLGVAVFFYCESDLPKPSLWVSTPLFIAALIFSRTNTHNIAVAGTPDISDTFINDLAVGLGFSLVLISFRDCAGRGLLSFGRLHKKMADFSYSLYLSQFPLLFLTAAILHDVFAIPFLEQPALGSLCYFFAILIGLYAYGYLFYFCTERHTRKIRIFILNLLGIKPSVAGVIPSSENITLGNVATTE